MNRLKHNLGASLLEVMIALLILAIGTLGILSMQINAMRMNQNAHLYSQAGFIANDIFEAMLSTSETNRNWFTSESGKSCDGKCADEKSLVLNYVHDWNLNVGTLLPQGKVDITRQTPPGEPPYYLIKVSFTQSSIEDDQEAPTVTDYELRVDF